MKRILAMLALVALTMLLGFSVNALRSEDVTLVSGEPSVIFGAWDSGA